jgi:dihydropteroate synthase
MKTVTVRGMEIGDGHPPRVMSVLNMSSQSGYKPSVYEDPEAGARFVDEELVPAGGDVIDVGLQSANPKYPAKAIEHELKRLEEVAPILDHVESDVPFSLETRYARVAEEAIGYGFDVINDVCGFADPDMKPTVEDHDVPVVKMASPPDLTRPGAVKTTDEVFEALSRDGFTDRTIIDPAFGMWDDEKTFEDNYEMFHRLREFRAFGRPILTATNREDFLGVLADKPETEDQLAVSLAAAVIEAERGSHVIRTHDTAETHDVLKVAHALGDRRVAATDGPVVVELPGVDQREAQRHERLGRGHNRPATDAVSLSFLVGDVAADDLSAAIAAGETVDGIVVVERHEGLYVAGTVPALELYADVLGAESKALNAVADHLREALSRRL